MMSTNTSPASSDIRFTKRGPLCVNPSCPSKVQLSFQQTLFPPGQPYRASSARHPIVRAIERSPAERKNSPTQRRSSQKPSQAGIRSQAESRWLRRIAFQAVQGEICRDRVLHHQNRDRALYIDVDTSREWGSGAMGRLRSARSRRHIHSQQRRSNQSSS